MSLFFKKRKRLALHYLSELEKAESNYRKGENVLEEFSQGDWSQIRPLQQWAVKNREVDEEVLKLCNDYPKCAPNLLSVLQGPDERIEWLEMARETAHRLGLFETAIAHLGNMAMTSRNGGRMDQAIAFLEELYEILKGRNDKEEANVLCMLGECYRTVGKYQEALDSFNQSLSVAGDQLYILKDTTYHNFGITYRNRGDISLSIENHELEKKFADEEGDLASLARANMSLGMIHYEQLEIHQALKYYEEAMVVTLHNQFKDNGPAPIYHVRDDNHKAELTYGVSTENWQKFIQCPIFGNRGVAATAIGKYEDALNSLRQAIKLAEEINHTRFEAVWLHKRGMVYHYLGEYENAIRCHNESLELAKSVGATRAVGFALAGLGKAKLARAYLDSNQRELFTINELIEAFNIATEMENPRDMQDWGVALSDAYLYLGKLDDADRIINQVRHHDIAENRYQVAALYGLIQARLGNQVELPNHSFERTLEITGDIIVKTPEFFTAQYIRGLALSGLALLSSNERANFVVQAQQAYRDALKITDAKGVINDALRLLDALKPLDKNNELSPVRAVLN